MNYPASEFSFAARKRLFEIRQHTSAMDEGLATEYAADSFERLTGPLVNPGFSRSDQGLVGIVANDIVVYDAPAAFLRRREPLFQLSEGDQVEILSSNLSSKASSVMIGLADGRVGYIDRVRTETVPVQSATIVTFAGSDTGGDSPLTPTLDLDEQALALLRSARARIEINLGTGESADNPAQESEGRRLAYVRGLTLRQELIGLGAETENIIVNVAAPGSQADSAEIRIGDLRGPR